MAFGEVLREFGVKISLAFDKKKVEEAQQKIDKLGSQLKHFSFEVAAAAAAIFEFANLSSSNARDLQQNADMLGLNVERLQELEYAAKVAAGVSRGELVGALEAVSDTLDKTRHGDVQASEGLLRLAQNGIGVDKMLAMIQDQGTTSEQVMVALSQSFKNIKDPLAAARLATEAFGGAGAKLLPLLKQGPEGFAKLSKEARSLGVVIGKNVIDDAAEMDRQFTKIWLVLKNVSYTIGYQLLKYIKPMVVEFERFVVSNKKLIATNIAQFMTVLGKAIVVAFHGAQALAKVAGVLIDKMGGVEVAAKLLIGTFLAFKGITFFATAISTISTLLGVVGMLIPSLTTVLGLFTAFKEASGALALIEGLADIMPALGLAGSALAAGLLPLLPYIAAIAALGVAIHDIWALIHDEPTWVGSAASKIGDMAGKAKNYLSNLSLPDTSAVANNSNAYATGGLAMGGAGAPTAQTFNITTENNIGIPPGTTANHAADIISKATDKSHEKMMRNAKNDAARSREY